MDQKKTAQILIELPTWLGDSVMASAAIENIVDYYGAIEITIIGSFSSIETLKHHPKIVKSIIFESKYKSLYKNYSQLGGFDDYFTFRSSFRATLLKLLVRSKNKYQFKKKNSTKNTHQVKQYVEFVNKSLNIDFPAGNLVVNNVQCRTLNSTKIIGINPGGTYGSAKRWYPDEFAKIATELSDRFDIVIFGGENERIFAEEIEKKLIQKKITNYRNLAGKTSISELINEIGNLDLFITGDSGPMHIAASLKIPTISIFGPTNDHETSQWNNSNSLVIKKRLDCQPCMKKICPLKHHNCMKLIKADEVLSSVKSLI